MIYYLVGVDDAGNPVVQIPDSNGRDHRYRLTREVDGVSVLRTDTGEGHTVRRDFALGLVCSCKAWEFRKRYGSEDCKHTSAIKVLEALAGVLGKLEVQGVQGVRT